VLKSKTLSQHFRDHRQILYLDRFL